MSEILELSENGVYEVTLASIPQSINIVDNLVDMLVLKYNISDDVYGNIITSLNEAVTNAIYHGNKQNPNKMVKLSVEIINQKKLICVVEDEGEGFDFNVLPDPTAPQNLENLTGRGVYIIKKLADQCIYSALGNQLEMHFRL